MAAPTPGKRTRSDGLEVPVEPSAGSSSDFTALLATHFSTQQERMQTDLKASNDALMASVSHLMGKMGERVDNVENTTRVHTERLNSVDERLQHLTTRQNELAKANDLLSDTLNVARKQTIEREDMVSDAFNRPPDMEKVRVSATKFVTVQSVEAALGHFLGEVVGLKVGDWRLVVDGNNGRNFALRFAFLPLQNARTVNQIMGKLKKESGEYWKFQATAPNESLVDVRLDRDENSKTRTQRSMAAVIKKAIAEIAPETENVHQRRNQRLDRVTVYSNKVPICTCLPLDADVKREYFQWNYEALPELGLAESKDQILAKAMALLEGPEEHIQWRV